MIVNPYRYVSGGAFSPTDITALTDWYDASYNTSITTVDGDVSQWDSREGANYLTQGTESLQPLSDDASDSVEFFIHGMEFNTSVSNKSGIFVVSNAAGTDVSNDLVSLIGMNTGSSGQDYILLRRFPDYTVSLDGSNNANTGDIQIDDGTLTPGDGTGTNISATGFVPFPNTATKHLVYYQLTNQASFTVLGQMLVGTQTFYGKVDMHDVYLFNDHLTPTELLNMVTYLNTKWSLGL